MNTLLSTRKRFLALDGLRGLAIILVLLNHIDSTVLVEAVPSVFQPILTALFTSGTWGVSWLFLLSGFLMAYIYKHPDSQFLQKRYTRIFPLFVTLTTVMWVFYLFPDFNPWYRFVFIFSAAFIVHLIWKQLQKWNNTRGNRTLFYGFVLLQICMVVWYGLGIMRQPALWFQELPYSLDELTVLLVNMTLTLPFGNYIPMLDGVYWSLAAEIYFYILYPVVFAPVARFVSTRSRTIQYAVIILSFFFFAGIHILAMRTNGFAMLQWPLFFYFVIGIAVGYLAQTEIPWTKRFSFLTHPISLLVMLYIAYFSVLVVGHMDLLYTYIRMLWAVPFGLVLFLLLDEKISHTSWLRTRPMLFLGTISYSLYLSHTAVIDAVRMIIPPDSPGMNVLFLLIVIVLAIGLATGLYYLLEKPYFTSPARNDKRARSAILVPLLYPVIAMSVVILVGVIMLYQSRFNLFSQEYAVQKDQITYSTVYPGDEPISLNDVERLQFTFTAPEDRLGIVGLYIWYARDNRSTVRSPGDEEDTRLVIRLKESGSEEWLATAQFKPLEVGESELHPFGLPLVPDSKGKDYTIEMFLEQKHPVIDIMVKHEGEIVRTIHQLDKSTILRRPSQLGELIQNKITNIVTNQEVQLITIHIVPLMGLLGFLAYKERREEKG